MEYLFTLENHILTSFLFTFCCLFYVIFLVAMYFSKSKGKEENIRAKIYKNIIIDVIVVFVLQIIDLFCIAYSNISWLNTLVSMLLWYSVIIWCSSYCIYCFAYILDTKETTYKGFIKSDKCVRLIANLTIILLVLYTLYPKDSIGMDNLKFINGVSEYGSLLFLFFMCIFTIVETLFVYKSDRKRKVIVSYIMAFIAFTTVLQLFFSDYILYPIILAIQLFFLYLMVENPDIHLAKEVDKLKVQVENSNKAKTDVLSNMSHEIRTPMNAIVGFSDSLLNSPKFDSEVARGDIQNIVTAGTNLIDIINNILDISRIESGVDELNNKECSIKKIIDELATVIDSRIGNDPIKLIVELDEQLPSIIYGDYTKIYQILLNIANNAVKYTEVGKIKITVDCEYLNQNKVLVHFKVTDTGYGIKKEDYNKVFEKFERIDEKDGTNVEGTGLGLVITKKFVNLMDGKIWFTSDYGVGTTFYVDIPFKVVDTTPIGNIKKEELTSDRTRFLDCSNFVALVVDDNPLNQKVTERLLKQYNFTVDISSSGKDAIYKFKLGNHYDIIFLDNMMSDLDGFETIHIIKSLKDYEIPPIIALTANAMLGMREKCLNAGFDYYLSLPINLKELDRIIHLIFEKQTVGTYVDSKKNNTSNNNLDKVNTIIEDVSDKKEDVKKKEEAPLKVKEEKPVVNDNAKKIDNILNNVDKKEEEKEEQEVKEEDSKQEDLNISTMEGFLRDKGVDMDSSLEFLGDMEMYNMTLNDFLNEVSAKWDRINKYKEDKDMPNYAIEVHSLKSDSKYLGFMNLADVSYEHELKSKANDLNFVNNNFSRLEKEFKKVLEIIKEYIVKYNIK